MSRRFPIVIILVFLAVFSFYEFYPVNFQPADAHGSSLIEHDSFDILHYTINLNITDIQSGSVSGVTDVQMRSLADTLRRITLQLKGLHVDSVWLDEEAVKTFSTVKDYIFIHLQEPVLKGNTAIITVFYHGNPVRDPRWGGVYFSENTAFVLGVCMSFQPPSGGRLWFPCIDDFREKATYDYFITVADSLTVACPGILEETIPANRHQKTFHWSLDSPVPTYLSTFAVSDYAVLKDTIRGMSENIPAVYFVPKPDSAGAWKTFSHIPAYLYTFESLFGPYQWQKIGFNAIPFPHGAMEHATCISVPNTAIDGSLKAENLLVHEFAHNWFGNLVTCATATDMWLNEGFASYCVALYIEVSRGRKSYLDYIRHLHRNVLSYTYLRDEGYFAVSDIPPSLTYGSTVYDKGADMIHNLRSYLGDNLFFESLHAYLGNFAFANASTDDFEKFLSGYTHKPLSDFFNTWINTPGFPHFQVQLDTVTQKNNDFICHITLSQQRVGRKDLSYHVPLEITFTDSLGNEEKHTVFLSGEKKSFSIYTKIKPALILLDKDEKINDATVSQYRTLYTTGEYPFQDCSFSLNVTGIPDSVFFRVVYHSISPDSATIPAGIILPGNFYWSVEGLFSSDFPAGGSFFYAVNYPGTTPDQASQAKTNKRIILLYKPLYRGQWKEIPAIIEGDSRKGKIVVSQILPGHYCIAEKKYYPSESSEPVPLKSQKTDYSHGNTIWSHLSSPPCKENNK